MNVPNYFSRVVKGWIPYSFGFFSYESLNFFFILRLSAVSKNCKNYICVNKATNSENHVRSVRKIILIFSKKCALFNYFHKRNRYHKLPGSTPSAQLTNRDTTKQACPGWYVNGLIRLMEDLNKCLLLWIHVSFIRKWVWKC